jgi:hypothetical protein
MINQKIIHHTENFWGSGSYSKTVGPNGIFIYRRFEQELDTIFFGHVVASLL